MHTLLTQDGYNRGNQSNIALERLTNIDRRQIEKAIAYYRGAEIAAPSDHPLVKMVYGFFYPRNAQPIEVYEWAVEKEAELAASVGFTSYIEERAPLKHTTYPDCDEYWVTMRNEGVDITFENENYIVDEVSPLMCLYQPYTMPVYTLPRGSRGDRRYVVLGVDIPALAVMHQVWAKWNLARPEGSRQRVEHFIGSWVLPNMLWSQADVSRLNMWLDNLGDVPAIYEDRPPIALIDNREEVKGEMAALQLDLDSRGYPFGYLLTQFPSLKVNQSLYDTRPQIPGVDTRALYRARFLASIPYVRACTLAQSNVRDLGRKHHTFKNMVRSVRIWKTLTSMKGDYVEDVKVWFDWIKFYFDA